MEDIPYSSLKDDERAYDILMLRDQYSNTFTAIAKDYGISLMRVRQIYDRIKVKQARLYIRHISIALGYETAVEIRSVFQAANECYQGLSYACAYLEKKYKSILEAYRAGEPGASEQIIKSLPPRKKLSKKEISRIIEMRETEKDSFIVIAKEMRITPEKARHAYDSFYHQQVLKYIYELQKKAKSVDEKQAIWRRYFWNNQSSKKRCEMILDEKNKS